MPNISKKGQRMPESPIRKLAPFAERAKENGLKVYQLNIGQPDIPTPQAALDAIHNYDEKVVAYSLSEGHLAYRRDLANYYQKLNLPVEASDILVTTGGSEALQFIMGSCFDEGDEIIIPEPFYANYNGFSTAYGVVVHPIPSSIEEGFALPDIDAFEKAIGPKTKGILICNPGNPTGYLYSKDEIDRLAKICLEHDLYLIADEVYREFCYDGHVHHSILSLPALKDHAIVVDSVSKRYSMCGVRIGCLITKNKEVRATAMKFAQARLSPPSFGQAAAHAALQTPDSYFEEIHAEYTERRNILVEGLNAIPGVFCPMPKGAFYCVASLPVDDAEDFAAWLLRDFSDGGKTLMLAPAGGFYSTPGMGRNEVRIAYVLGKEALKDALQLLEKALNQYNA
jgi:aspartate aminotransferase